MCYLTCSQKGLTITIQCWYTISAPDTKARLAVLLTHGGNPIYYLYSHRHNFKLFGLIHQRKSRFETDERKNKIKEYV